MFKRFGYRLYQSVLYVASYFLNFREPRVLSGSRSSGKIASILIEKHIKHVLIVTDESLFKLGLLDRMIKNLEDDETEYAIYKGVVPNPTIANIEEALALYKQSKAKAIIAFGGGSSIDTAKGVAARVANPRKSIEKMKGILKVGGKIPLLIAVPTTAGTGSEATVAAVIVNPETRSKYAINSPKLIPHYAILDPDLLVGLPKSITATTGMDAMTHAIEAYIGRSNTSKTALCAISSIELIDKSLLQSYENPSDIHARKDMQLAAFQAGLAFTRAYVGYVHALAHALGGKFNVAHGLANAIILPYVLERFGSAIHRRLAVLSDAIKLTSGDVDDASKAAAFIAYLKNLNHRMQIPDKFVGIYEEKDIAELAAHALEEANPLYPVPTIMDLDDLKAIYRKMI